MAGWSSGTLLTHLEQFENKVMACMGLLKTICSLLLSVESSVDISLSLQFHCYVRNDC